MSKKKCLFCGDVFSGQRHNFEHVIPTWLVKEADLSKRMAPVSFPNRQFKVAMNRIGTKFCEVSSSDLEARAKVSYIKIRDGECLNIADERALLDWLDKVRVGLWLWLLDSGKRDFGFSPKFRINERMAHKDRILLIAKYPTSDRMKGLAIWGAHHFFVWSPSAIGFMCNNIVLISFSSDFLLCRHLLNLKIERKINDSDIEEYNVETATNPGTRLTLLGDLYILGQCIIPNKLFDELGLTQRGNSIHPGWREGSILRLDRNLKPLTRDESVPTFAGSKDAHIALMELNLALVTKFLIGDFLNADFTRISRPDVRQRMLVQAREYLLNTEFEISRFKDQYFLASGIRLPSF